MTIVKDIQRHPVKRDVMHVDFLRIDPNKNVIVDIPMPKSEWIDISQECMKLRMIGTELAYLQGKSSEEIALATTQNALDFYGLREK